MRVVQQAVEDSVGDCRLTQRSMPVLDGELAGDDGCVTLVSVFDDFEKIGCLLRRERLQAEVVDDQASIAGE